MEAEQRGCLRKGTMGGKGARDGELITVHNVHSKIVKMKPIVHN